MSVLRTSIITIVLLAAIGGLSFAVYYFATKDNNSGANDWKKDLSVDEARATYDPEHNTFKSYNNCGDRQLISLTFDDGPNVQTTPTVLQDLQAAGVKATFFISPAVAGEPSIEQCQLVPQILKAGHSIQSHSWNHVSFQELSDDDIALNLLKVRRWIEDCAGDELPKLSLTQFRPPFGQLSGARARFVTELGYTIAGWNVDSADTAEFDGHAENADEAFTTITTKFATDLKQRGSIVILMHDASYSSKGVAGLIPRVVTHFRNLGYTFVDAEACYKDCQPFGVGICENVDIWPRFKTL